MFSSSSVRRLAVLPAWAACAAFAQAPAPAADPAARADFAPPVLAYRSAFEGYRPFDEASPVPWKDANDTVLRRGGWRAYAREAAAEPAPDRDPDAGRPTREHPHHHGGEAP